MSLPEVAVLVHGAGSTPDAVVRLLGPAVPPGAQVVALDGRGHVDDVVRRLDDAVAATAQQGRRVVLAGGVSLGAHAVALWAAGPRCVPGARVLLAMPAWTGEPDDVAAATAASADELARDGAAPLLARLLADPVTAGDWVVDELVRAWSDADGEALAASLRAAATSAGPTLAHLAAIAAPTAVVALADDPLHPEAVARLWAATVPHAALAVVGRHEPGADRGALGRAAVRVWGGAAT